MERFCMLICFPLGRLSTLLTSKAVERTMIKFANSVRINTFKACLILVTLDTI
jgi:hypothetical protein